MRKNAGFMMLTLLLLIVPALANAWTLTVKVAGGTAAQAVTVAYQTSGDVQTTKTLKVGTNYLYPKAGIVLAAAGTPTYKINGVDADLAAVNALATGPRTVTVTYTPAAVIYNGLNLTQVAGGSIFAQNLNNTWSNSSVAGYVEGALIPVTIAADGNHTITGYTVNGARTAAAGKVVSFTLAAAGQTVVPEFAVDAKISASLFAPTNAVAGKAVTLSVAATSNDTTLLYSFSTDNGATFTTASAAASYTFTPAEGTVKVAAKVASANGGSFTTAVSTIVVANAVVDANSQCASCHSQQPSVHGYTGLVNSCASCHSATPHNAGAVTAHAASINCSGCHEPIKASFAVSQHGSRQGKATWYTDNLNNAAATELQKGFGNYVQVAYAALPCGKCHNAAAWTPAGGTDQWAALTGGVSVCNDCHGNKAAGVDTTAVTAPVSKTTCFGCHSRQANESAAGLTDVHFAAGMGCMACHSTADMHGTGTQSASQLQFGTISAQCENCHGQGKARGPISTIAAHVQHAGDIACSTCHAESMITCHNCHFDNEAGAGGALKAKFFSGRFGGTAASGNSWRFLVNRVMPDGSTKIYPGSMQSLVADHTVDGVNDGQGHTHAGIAPYYSHTITRVNALSCDKCHGTETAVKLAAGQPVRVTTWKAAAGEAVPAANVAATFVGPKGVIPVPENPRGKLLMDFVDLTDPTLGTASPRVLFQKDGPDTIHMPEAYVKPLTAAQMQKLADVQLDHGSAVATSAAATAGYDANTCKGCHQTTNASFAKSQHGTREGKATFYNDNLGNAAAQPLQKGFGNYVNVAYNNLPCAKCHNPAAWTIGGVDTWPGTPVCTDCHTNRTITNGVLATTAFDAPVTAATCKGCHSRQVNEAAMGLTDVHLVAGMSCYGCHGYSDMHGNGQATATQLADGAISAKCENCHADGKDRGAVSDLIPEHAQHLANIACSTCHMESVITCYGCHFDNEASDPADATILHAKFASGKFGGTGANAWRFLVNRVMPDGSTKIYPASMQSLVSDRTAANAPGEDNQGWTHAAIAPYYSHSITRVNALKCDKCHGIQNAINLRDGLPVRVVKWAPNPATYPDGIVPVSALGAGYTVKPSGVIPVPENPVGKLLMDFVDLTNPAAGPLNAGGTSPSPRVLFKADGPDSIHMPEQYVRPLTAAQINSMATPQVRP